MNPVKRLRQYLGKASFSSESDRYSALECLAEIEHRLPPELFTPQWELFTPQCGYCCGTGWVVRDPDIGTDQECFVCDGTGYIREDN